MNPQMSWEVARGRREESRGVGLAPPHPLVRYYTLRFRPPRKTR